MNDQKKISKKNAVSRVVNSTIEFFQEFNILPESEFIDGGNVLSLSSSVAHPIANLVIQAKLEPETIDTDIQEIIATFRKKGRPFNWIVWPNSSPDNLEDHLEANGLTFSSAVPDMIADLDDLPDKVTQTVGLLIERVTNEKMLSDWMIPIEQAFQLPDDLNAFFLRSYLHLGLDETKPTQHYVAYLDGKPVACSTVFLGSNQVAGIWNVATIAEARGNGIGTAVTWKACREAKQQRYANAILRSTEMGFKVYKRLGFVECSKDKVYLWQPLSSKSN